MVRREYDIDGVILGLVKILDGMVFPPKTIKPPYSYFDLDKIKYKGKLYKLVWLLEDDPIYIGVVNAYRR